jgi:hypothetical protein
MAHFMLLPSLVSASLRRLAALMMLLAAVALAPAAIAGSFEAGTDFAKIAVSSYSIDGDGCVTEAQPASGDTQPASTEHCPACCLHHHGPNGVIADAFAIEAFSPARSAWNSWEPSGPVEAPEPVLIQPPRA